MCVSSITEGGDVSVTPCEGDKLIKRLGFFFSWGWRRGLRRVKGEGMKGEEGERGRG